MSRPKVPDHIDLDKLEEAIRNRGGLAWMDQARCIGVPNNVFFPERTDKAGYRPARDICCCCPVRHECLAHNLDEKWGHLAVSPGERKTIRVTLELRREDAA